MSKNLAKIVNNKELHQMLLDLDVSKYSNMHSSDIVISLTSIPPRFLSDEFERVLESLYVQKLKAKYIVLHLCDKYLREFEYDSAKLEEKIKYYKDKYENLIVNITQDYGPGTKILGMHKIKIIEPKPEDIIVICDDDIEYLPILTLAHAYVHDLYDPDAVFVDERNIIDWDNRERSYDVNNKMFYTNEGIFYDNYDGLAFGWLAYSLIYSNICEIYKFYNEIIQMEPSIISHDDLIIGLAHKVYDFYSCGINMFFGSKNSTQLDKTDPLRLMSVNDTPSWIYRQKLEQKLLAHYNFPYTVRNNVWNVCTSSATKPNDEEYLDEPDITIKQIGEKLYILTYESDVSTIDDNLDISIRLDDKLIDIKIENTNKTPIGINKYSGKKSWFIQIQEETTARSCPDISNILDNIQLHKITNDIIISLNTTSERFMSDEFDSTINSLFAQKLPAKYIIINLVKSSDELDDRAKSYQLKYPNLVINWGEKLGLIAKSLQVSQTDMVILLSDMHKYSNDMTTYYTYAHQLYNPDSIVVYPNESSEYIFNDSPDKYSSFYGYSIRFKYIEEIEKKSFEEFCKINKIYKCSINKSFILGNIRTDDKYIILDKQIDTNISIDSHIQPRYALNNVKNIKYNPRLNDWLNKQIDIKYFSDNCFVLTLVTFGESLGNKETVIYEVNHRQYTHTFTLDKPFRKVSWLINTEDTLIIIPHARYNFNILQVNISHNKSIGLSKFYSIGTILNYIPNINYVLFTDKSAEQFISDKSNDLLNMYNKLNPGAFKADLFRALYLYVNGGIYFDCKNILFDDISTIFAGSECYTQERAKDMICNGFIYNSLKNDTKMKAYLAEMIYNIFNNIYTKSHLSITGPGLFGKFIKNNIKLIHILDDGHEWMNASYMGYIDGSKNILLKDSYTNYYLENNYLNTAHYGVLFQNRQVYKPNELFIDYKKCNGIQGIAWINLDRAETRRKSMEKLMSNIMIPNYRIKAVDGNDPTNLKLFESINCARNKLTNYEKACTLSHIEAIYHFDKLPGNYFMICEDDINFNNLLLLEHDLEHIIANAPNDFDILLVHAIMPQNKNLTDTYTDWNKYYIETKLQIASTACYVISRKGINKFMNLMKDLDTYKKFDVADMFLYSNSDTWVYKYNFAESNNIDSFIHPSHLAFHNSNTKNAQKHIIIDIIGSISKN